MPNGPGALPLFSPVQVAGVKAVACALPKDGATAVAVVVRRAGPPGGHHRDLLVDLVVHGAAVVDRGRDQTVAVPVVDLHHRPRLPGQGRRLLDLYQRVWDGKPLGPNDFVICSDEKPSIQARCRCHPTLAPGKTRTMRVNHDYQRRGALTYLAAYDVHQAKIVGRCEEQARMVRSPTWSRRS